jgi:Amt family ammonium transporter
MAVSDEKFMIRRIGKMNVNAGDTAWILIATALVMVMTPALAFFYGGMVRKKNVLSTLNLSFITIGLISIQWIVLGYSLAFGSSVGGLFGGLNFFGLAGVAMLTMRRPFRTSHSPPTR